MGEICAQLIVLLAADEGNSGTESINAVLARRGTLVSTLLNSLFTKRIRRALMSAVQLPFAEVIKVEFAEEDPTRAPPVVSLVRPGRTEGARKAYTRLADGKTNVLQFIETNDVLATVEDAQLLEWFRRGTAVLCRPGQSNIDLLISVMLPWTTREMTCLTIQVKNRLVATIPQDGKVCTPMIKREGQVQKVPNLFIYLDLNGSAVRG